MKTSEQTDKIDAAMAKVQQALGPIAKNKIVDTSRDGGNSGWKSGYTTLDALYSAAHDHLAEHRVVVYQGGDFVQGLGPVLVTRLAHDGQWVQSFFPIKTSRDGAQGFGGGVTFARRWGLCCAVGLVPADAEEGQGYKDAAREAKAPRKAAAPGGLGALVDAIRSADSGEAFFDAAAKARAAHPTGEASQTIERTITTRMVTAIDNADTPDRVAVLRRLHERLQARGAEVRDAFARADRRMRGEVGP
jgi:hypothetical protein